MVLAVVSAVIFFVLLNLSFFINENRIKGILERGDFYNAASFYIKNEIVTKSDFKLNEGTNFEDLNRVINAENIKEIIDNGLHSIFAFLKNPGNSQKVFPIKFNGENSDGTKFYFEKYFNIQNNLIFEILSKREIFLLAIGGASVIFLLFGLLFFIKNPKGGLAYLGVFSLILIAILTTLAIAMRLFNIEYMDNLVKQINLFQEAKLQVILKRLLLIMVDKQFYYYLLEIISFLVLSITFFSLRKMLVREDLDEIGKKI